jgi:LAO/AO transport system kinase
VAQASNKRGRLTARHYLDGILNGDRVTLARAITVVESDLASDAELADELLEDVLPYSGKARRVGITGAPGVGKSTFIDTLGMHLIRERAEKVAVLSVDPSSPLSGGSILGDKVRMERLAAEDKAFIRPSPARGHLGGVARRTRETMLLCEAAGYQNVLVETVGVGQSETAVRSMTDFFLLLMIAGAGDELQGIKRGILEMIDGMAINKADGDNERKAEQARAEYASALRLFRPGLRVLTISSLNGTGIAKLWEMILEHRAHSEASGCLERRRQTQALDWMRELLGNGLQDLFRTSRGVSSRLPELEAAVRQGSMTPSAAARELLSIFRNELS